MAKRINIAGWSACGFYKKAKVALTGLETIFPDKFSVTVNELPDRTAYREWLASYKKDVPAADKHTSSPIVWFDNNNYLGGCDDTLKWCRSVLSSSDGEQETNGIVANVNEVDTTETYDYDLVVIGGGSGGLACSKEASQCGAKVAVLDFVKPSPAGSTWGLGGTCVNVGCIPKKLMHNAALLKDAMADAPSYGWNSSTSGVHNWDQLKDNVQNHIKSLNFGYRVSLREKGVTYLNSLGKFVGPHKIECTDKKGNVKTITAARFVIAVGGRPTKLSCPGAEYAISSDDIFMKETAPGKTCVIGAGYVALECGGFINGLKQGEVTVLVRSIPLRGFDRESVQYITDYMTAEGINIVEGVTPSSIVKQSDGKLLVTYSNGASDTFDTVLCAVGRYADLEGLDLAALGTAPQIDAKSGKLICTNEQTSIPHVYAIGDVIHGAPELTPVAIKAGTLLAKRLYQNSHVLMKYKDVATTVFTPIEFGTIGLNEEEAKAEYGEDNVDAYMSVFQPLEWTISEHRENKNCMAKIIVHTGMNEKVLGLQIVAPNAGEMMQGFAVAFRKGLTYQDLQDTVGIHPTVAEEYTVMSVKKSSGDDIAKKGC